MVSPPVLTIHKTHIKINIFSCKAHFFIFVLYTHICAWYDFITCYIYTTGGNIYASTRKIPHLLHTFRRNRGANHGFKPALLPSVNLSGVGHAIGISMFGIYAVVSLGYIKYSMLEAVRVKDRVKEDFYKRGPNGMD
jgi:ABC-type phosphate transport system permease subunit